MAARLGRLTLRDFRNFERVTCEFPPAGVAIVGPNGSGKTNLLESIYYLEIFKSFRGARDRELVRLGEDVFRVEGVVHRGGEARELAAAYRTSGSRKKVERDGREVGRFSDAIGSLGAVVFCLDDVEIVRGSPGERRRFLDILLSLVEPGYVDALQRYRKVLSQRNEALREGARPAAVEPWTNHLVEAGAVVMAARHRWIATRSDAFGTYHRRIAGGTRARMAYEPSVDRPAGEAGEGESTARGNGRGPGREAWAERFRASLQASAERERRRGVTVVGPHRDDVAFRGSVADAEERDLRTYGSGGQQRTAALALRLTEADTLRDRLVREPIYLLDDVFAELDRERSERVMALLDEGRSGQVIVTAPKEGDVTLRGGGLERWTLRGGELSR